MKDTGVYVYGVWLPRLRQWSMTAGFHEEKDVAEKVARGLSTATKAIVKRVYIPPPRRNKGTSEQAKQ